MLIFVIETIVITSMYNRELQSIDTQEKAYLLGLFYSDGNIGLNQAQCRVGLKLEDKDLIFQLQKLFPFFYIHYDRGAKIELGCYTKTLKTDLIFNGCFPRKSFENKKRLHIPNIRKELVRHFIRGYFDGNGGCTLSYSGKKTQKRVYIYSVSIDFLKEIQKEFICNNIISNLQINNKVGKLTINIYSYTSFYNYLYRGCSIFMKRKLDKFSQILSTNFFIQRETPPCRFCNSLDTVCDGYNYYKIKKQRYLCKTCKRHFTAPIISNNNSGEGELLEA